MCSVLLGVYMLVIIGACHVQCHVVGYMLVIVGACHVQCLLVVLLSPNQL